MCLLVHAIFIFVFLFFFPKLKLHFFSCMTCLFANPTHFFFSKLLQNSKFFGCVLDFKLKNFTMYLWNYLQYSLGDRMKKISMWLITKRKFYQYWIATEPRLLALLSFFNWLKNKYVIVSLSCTYGLQK